MKFAIICLTKDFNRPGNSGSYRDYLYIKKELELIGEVTTINSETLYDKHPDYDGIVMLNASVNFFGGVVNAQLLDKWKFIAEQKCPIMYWFTDFLLPFQNIVPIVKKRFDITLPEISSNQITVISYAKETEMTKEWWNSDKKNIPIHKIVYYPLSESCYKHLPHLEPKENPIDKVVYIGNFRNGHRRKQIEALSAQEEIAIYGNWPEKFVPFGAEYHGKISEDKVDECLNSYRAQYITYDYEYLKFKPDIFRNIITINSGCLPLLDQKLEYIIPSIKSNFISSFKGTDRLQSIKLLQKALETQFLNNFSQLINDICLNSPKTIPMF